MPYARKSGKISRKRTSRKGTVRRYRRRSNTGYRILSKRISAVSRRVAGEVCKFESTPNNYTNSLITVGTSIAAQTPLNTITSGEPWIMPINWTYYQATGSATGTVYANGSQLVSGQTYTLSMRNPIWYNTTRENIDNLPNSDNFSQTMSDVATGLQYRLKYIYINALFNASISSSVNNTDGALRCVIVKDKQPTGGSATWFDSNGENTRGVFNANRIDAQLNPNTVGRFKILYDKTLRFNTTNGYKPFKYYKQFSTIVRNNRDLVPITSSNNNVINNQTTNSSNYLETSDRAPPVQKNAFYLMIFSDGLNFTYSTDATTPAAGFHLFNRVAYYNN